MRKTLKRWAGKLVWALFPTLDVKIELATGVIASLQQHSDIKMLQEVFCEGGYADFLGAIPAPITSWIDVGANCGLFSLYLENMARRQGWAGPRRAILIEPNRYALRSLYRSLSHSRLDSQFSVREAILADKSQSHTYYESSTTYRCSIFAARRAHARHIPTVDLDQLVAQLGGQVDLIKMDIEGAEKMVINTWSRALIQARHIIIEWHTPHCSCHDIDTLLRPHGYRRTVTQAGFGVARAPGQDIADLPMGVGLWSR